MNFTPRYNNNPYKDDGKEPSATQVLDILGKPWLVQWATKVERETIVDLWWAAHSGLKHFDSKEEIAAYLEPFKNNFREVSKKAMDLGSLVHGMVDAYWQVWVDGQNPYPSSVGSYLFFLDDYYPANALKMLGAYFRCLKENNIIIYETEKTVHNYGYSGTLDMIAKVNGVWSIGDLKTGDPAKIGPPAVPKYEHKLQVEAYRRCPNARFNGYECSGRFIIYLRKDQHAGKYCFWYSDDLNEAQMDYDDFMAAKQLFGRAY